MKTPEIKGRSTAHELARRAIETREPVRTGYYTGTGRWSTAVDNTDAVAAILAAHGIRTVRGNDAPRGGVTGAWVRVATLDEATALRGRELQGAAHREATLILRAHQVLRQMQHPPVPFVQRPGDVMPHAAIYGTPREQDYKGCGRITMYLTIAGELAAYHYGHTVPEGWTVPEGLTPRRGNASCGEACWW